MELLQTLFGFIVALVILVAVHEFGHFYVARLCGIKVLRFCIGLGAPIWSIKDKRGTEFAIAPFPLGGYVKLLDSREVDVAEEDKHLSFNAKSVWQRIAVLAAGPIANFILAVVLFWVVVTIKGQVGYAPVIGSVVPDSLADRSGLEAGQEIVAVDGVHTDSRMAVLEQLFRRLGETGTLELGIKNPESDLRFDVDVPLDRWMADAKDPNPVEGLGVEFFLPQIQFGEPAPETAAARSGLLEGDILLAIDGQKNLDLRATIEYIRARPEVAIKVNILRENQEQVLEVTPQRVSAEGGQEIGQFGIPLSYHWSKDMVRVERFGIAESFVESLSMTWDKSQFVLMSMVKLVQREISVENLSGPIGIAKVAGDHARAGLIYFVEFLALLSIYLGVLNLLPIPILDGGQILYCLIEAVKGSPLSERMQMMGFSMGLALLLLVMFVAIYNDILRLQ